MLLAYACIGAVAAVFADRTRAVDYGSRGLDAIIVAVLWPVVVGGAVAIWAIGAIERGLEAINGK